MKKILALVFCAAAVCRGAEFSYTEEGTVGEVISGEDSVRVNCGSGKFVTFTGDNSYGGDTVIESGGVVVGHPNALGTGRILCAPGTMVRIGVVGTSFKNLLGAGETLNSKIIDRIEVQSVEGGEEPWVSLQFTQSSMDLDVDLSRQQHLWIGGNVNHASSRFTGKITPWNNQYRFGHMGVAPKAYDSPGFPIPSLGDGENGEPRSVLIRGKSTMRFTGKSEFTGDITLEDGAWIWTGSTETLAASTVASRTFRMRDGTRWTISNPNCTFAANINYEVEGAVDIHSCGAANEVVSILKGNVGGSGTINLTGQGGVRFGGAANTFTGTVKVSNQHSGHAVEVGIGDGDNCSWAGDGIEQPSGLTNHVVRVRNNSDFTLNADLGTTGGRLVKMGKGKLTLTKPFLRSPKNEGDVMLEILEGTVKPSADQEFTGRGMMRLDRADCILDMGAMEGDKVWLPFGGGAIANVPAGGVTLYGSGSTEVFMGAVEGAAKVDEPQGGLNWRLGDGARIDGKLEIESGGVTVLGNIAVNGITVGESGALSFGDEPAGKRVGLKVSVWNFEPDWSSGMAELFTRVMAEKLGTRPNIETDMKEFGPDFRSNNPDMGCDDGANSAFAKIMGGSKDFFLASFDGRFMAESEGEYTFQIGADDGVMLKIDGVELGRQSLGYIAYSSHKVQLTAGWHDIQVVFLEKTASKILHVKYMGPGMEAAEFVPVRLLGVPDAGTGQTCEVDGTGSVYLGPGGKWPENMAFENFTGRVLANDMSATDEAGTLKAGAVKIDFDNHPTGVYGENWKLSAVAKVESDENGSRIVLGGAASIFGNADTREKIDLNENFALRFKATPVKPMSSPGDGFVVALHEGKQQGCAGMFAWDETTARRVSNGSAMGMQFRITGGTTLFSWIKDGTLQGEMMKDVEGKKFVFQQNKPMDVKFSLSEDGMKIRLEKEGVVWESTAPMTRAEALERFPNGAHLGIWLATGGFYLALQLDDLSVMRGENLELPGEVALKGKLGLIGGDVTLGYAGAGGDFQRTIGAEIVVEGPARLTNSVEEAAVKVTSGTWRFDATRADATLGFAGAFDFSGIGGPVTVELEGKPCSVARVLADFREAVPAPEGLSFRLGEGYPSSWGVYLEGGLLRFREKRGTVIVVR